MADRATATVFPEDVAARDLGSEVGDLGPDEDRWPKYAMQGAACDRDPHGTCFLDPAQRTRFVEALQDRMDDARDAYATAITSLQIERMLEKDDDIPWVVSTLIEVASIFLTEKLTKSMSKLAKKGSEALSKLLGDAQVPKVTEDLARSLTRVLKTATDERLKAGTKVILDSGKKAAIAALKAEYKSHGAFEQDAQTSFLASLKEQVRLTFIHARETLPATASDGELVGLFDSLDPRIHTEAAYKDALLQKMHRFETSGVPEIGRKEANREPGLEMPRGGSVLRDTRVVWVEFEAGKPPELRFQHHDGDYIPILDPRGGQVPQKLLAHGTVSPVTEKPELGEIVPAEFVGAAIARHVQVFGSEPEKIVMAPDWAAFREGAADGNAHPRPEPPSRDFFREGIDDGYRQGMAKQAAPPHHAAPPSSTPSSPAPQTPPHTPSPPGSNS